MFRSNPKRTHSTSSTPFQTLVFHPLFIRASFTCWRHRNLKFVKFILGPIEILLVWKIKCHESIARFSKYLLWRQWFVMRVNLREILLFFFLCISSLIVETKIYKYLRFGLILIDTCSADITYFVILWKILSMYSILHMCCRNIVVNIQQLLRNSLRFSPLYESFLYLYKKVNIIWGCNFVLEYFKKIIYLIEISFFLSKEA